jgi:Na+/melibiose symporter-like transporter
MALVRSISGNPPFLYFVTITVTVEMATSMNSALALLYVQDYLGLGSSFFLLGILPAVAGIAAAPLWVRVSVRLDKQRAWAAGLLMAVLLSLPVLLLRPGAASLVPLLAIATAVGAMQGVAIPIPSAILADVADYQAWKQGTIATGNYYSLLVLISKITPALGTSVAFGLSGALGYVPHSQSGGGGSAALMVPFVVVPLALTLVGATLAYYFPLNRRRQAAIRRRLASRQARRAASGAGL